MVTKKKPRGRPRIIKIDKAKAVYMASKLCTYKEMAAAQGVASQTFRDRLKADEDLRKAVEMAEAEAKLALREKQYEKALNGDAKMLAKLGDAYLDQHNTTKLVGDAEAPLHLSWAEISVAILDEDEKKK